MDSSPYQQEAHHLVVEKVICRSACVKIRPGMDITAAMTATARNRFIKPPCGLNRVCRHQELTAYHFVSYIFDRNWFTLFFAGFFSKFYTTKSRYSDQAVSAEMTRYVLYTNCVSSNGPSPDSVLYLLFYFSVMPLRRSL